MLRAHLIAEAFGDPATLCVHFDAEETGDYGYVCTDPGHWTTMQGTMHIE